MAAARSAATRSVAGDRREQSQRLLGRHHVEVDQPGRGQVGQLARLVTIAAQPAEPGSRWLDLGGVAGVVEQHQHPAVVEQRAEQRGRARPGRRGCVRVGHAEGAQEREPSTVSGAVGSAPSPCRSA